MGTLGDWQPISEAECYSLARYKAAPWLKLAANVNAVRKRGQVVVSDVGGETRRLNGTYGVPGLNYRFQITGDCTAVEVRPIFGVLPRTGHEPGAAEAFQFRVTSSDWAGGNIVGPIEAADDAGSPLVVNVVPQQVHENGLPNAPGERILGLRAIGQDGFSPWQFGHWAFGSGCWVHDLGGAAAGRQIALTIEALARWTAYMEPAGFLVGCTVREIIP